MDLARYQFHRVVQVPKRDEPTGATRPGERPDPIVAALMGSHTELLGTQEHHPGLLFGWVRNAGDQQLQLLLGGLPFFPPVVDRSLQDRPTHASVLFPPGARAISMDPGEVIAQLGKFPAWLPCASRSDALWSPSTERSAPPIRGMFDRYAENLRAPFAWLVLAEPVRPSETQNELDRLVSEILPLTRTEVGEARRIELERKRGRHRELSRSQVSGTWRIRVLVGSVDAAETSTTATVLCAAAELSGVPYALEPAGPVRSFAEVMEVGADAANTIIAGQELLIALARPPERELPGVRVVESPHFDLNQEPGAPGAPDVIGLELGDVTNATGLHVGKAILGGKALNRHTFVSGSTGSGKSMTVRQLLAEATRSGLPWLVVEPAKAEYDRMAPRVAEYGSDVIVIKPGDLGSPPAGFNPLEPVAGFSLQTHSDLLKSLFLAAFESHEPFPQVLSAALVRCYEELGWDLTLSASAHGAVNPRYPTLGDLQRVAAQVVEGIGYGAEVASDVGGFIKVRLSSLRLGTTGRFFEGGHPLDFEALLQRNVVFQIEDVGDDADKAFLMGAVLMRLTEHLRTHRKDAGSLVHLTVIEEAHRLLRRPEPGVTGASAKAVEMFASMLAEVRAYGEGLIVAEQIPSKLTPEVIKNTAVKIVHRVPAQDDRDAVGATMNLDPAQSRHIVTLTPGLAAVFTDGMDRPMLVGVERRGFDVEKRPAEPGLGQVGSIIGRRSEATCGPDCRAEACTLRQMREAQNLLTEHRWLSIWAELTVLAHLSGYPTPRIDRDALPDIDAVLEPRRRFDCAISHAVDGAVATRSALLPPSVDTGELAAHCCSTVRDAAGGADPRRLCQSHGYRYLASRYLVIEPVMLLAGNDEGDETPAHPSTGVWEGRLGRRIPGRTAFEQRRAVNGWLEEVKADRSACAQVTFGVATPSALELAIGAARTDAAWPDRVRAAVAPLDAPWVLGQLHDDTADIEDRE